MIFTIGVSIVKCTYVLYLTAGRSSTLKVLVLRRYLELSEPSMHRSSTATGFMNVGGLNMGEYELQWGVYRRCINFSHYLRISFHNWRVSETGRAQILILCERWCVQQFTLLITSDTSKKSKWAPERKLHYCKCVGSREYYRLIIWVPMLCLNLEVIIIMETANKNLYSNPTSVCCFQSAVHVQQGAEQHGAEHR